MEHVQQLREPFHGAQQFLGRFLANFRQNLPRDVDQEFGELFFVGFFQQPAGDAENIPQDQHCGAQLGLLIRQS